VHLHLQPYKAWRDASPLLFIGLGIRRQSLREVTPLSVFVFGAVDASCPSYRMLRHFGHIGGIKLINCNLNSRMDALIETEKCIQLIQCDVERSK
jgi:hypothetical protein